MSDDEFAAAGAPDDELSLPKATIQKIIQSVLPPELSCARDTRDLLIECCVEFIHLVSSESNEICERESRKTIAPDHVVQALKDLGFDQFAPAVEETLQSHKAMTKERETKSRKMKDTGMSPEELLKHQEMLFAQSKARYDAAN